MPKLPDNCPICGEKMEKGYMTSTRRIRWSKEKTSSWNRRGDEVLIGSYWSGTCEEMYRCPKCRIVLFSY